MIIPIITLIGQKNTGKSTLFNRLTRTRDALIANYSGLTRDRQYGRLNCQFFKSIIVDTGGIDESYFNNINFNDGVYYQTTLAIKEANIILFVVDSHLRNTFVDDSIVSFLRTLGKIIFIVINKVDDIKCIKNFKIWEYYNFGIKNVIAISAMHGHGVHTLLKKISYQIQQEIHTNNSRNGIFIVDKNIISKKERLKKFLSISSAEKRNNFIILAVVGRPNTGKSTFINNVLGIQRMITCNLPGTTRDSIYTTTVYNGQTYVLIDTAGINNKSKFTNSIVEQISTKKTFQVIKDAHVVLFMINAEMGISNQDLSALRCVMNIAMSLIIVVNKWDSISTLMRCTIKEVIYTQMKFIEYVQVYFISALYGYGIKNLFHAIRIICNGLIDIRTVSTAKLTSVMRMAITERSPPLFRKKVKIQPKYVHVGGYSPLTFIIHGSHVSELSDDYQRYLKKYFYKSLNIKGTLLHMQFKDASNYFNHSKKLCLLE